MTAGRLSRDDSEQQQRGAGGGFNGSQREEHVGVSRIPICPECETSVSNNLMKCLKTHHAEELDDFTEAKRWKPHSNGEINSQRSPKSNGDT